MKTNNQIILKKKKVSGGILLPTSPLVVSPQL